MSSYGITSDTGSTSRPIIYKDGSTKDGLEFSVAYNEFGSMKKPLVMRVASQSFEFLNTLPDNREWVWNRSSSDLMLDAA